MKKLQEEKCQVIDCQVFTEHLQSFGARMIPRDQYLNLLDKNI
jgi:leucyl/phenylalanyl-tRNA--protein transferase